MKRGGPQSGAGERRMWRIDDEEGITVSIMEENLSDTL